MRSGTAIIKLFYLIHMGHSGLDAVRSLNSSYLSARSLIPGHMCMSCGGKTGHSSL